MTLFFNIILLVVLAFYNLLLLSKMIKRVSSLFSKIYFITFSTIHFGVSLAYIYFLDTINTPDPLTYYYTAVNARDWLELFDIGRSIISFFIYPLVKLNISIEVLFLLFSTISFRGFIIIFELIGVEKIYSKNKFLLLFFLIPSLHFWTGFLGKEALLLYLMALLLKKNKYLLYDLSLVPIFIAIFLIRPHAFFILIFALVIVFLFDNKLSKKVKRDIVLFSTVILVVLVPITIIYFLKIKSFEMISLQKYYNDFLIYTENQGNTSIDLINTSIFTRIIYLVIMPLPFLYNINNQVQLIASIENTFLLIIFLYSFILIFKQKFKCLSLQNDQKFSLISTVLMILLFSFYLYNLGLGNRMRVMFFPYLFYYLIMTIDTNYENHYNKV